MRLPPSPRTPREAVLGTLRLLGKIARVALIAQACLVLGFSLWATPEAIESGEIQLTSTCPSLQKTGEPCATCGTTRGLAAMGGLQWGRAWDYNPLSCALFLGEIALVGFLIVSPEKGSAR